MHKCSKVVVVHIIVTLIHPVYSSIIQLMVLLVVIQHMDGITGHMNWRGLLPVM